jgi:hypothetical protein
MSSSRAFFRVTCRPRKIARLVAICSVVIAIILWIDRLKTNTANNDMVKGEHIDDLNFVKLRSDRLSCINRCGSDIMMQSLSDYGKEQTCICQQDMCNVTLSSLQCCPDMEVACTSAIVSGSRLPQNEPPVGFPPRHEGKQNVYLDAVFVIANHLVRPFDLIEWMEHMRYGGVAHFIGYVCSGSKIDLTTVEPYIRVIERLLFLIYFLLLLLLLSLSLFFSFLIFVSERHCDS